VDLGDGDGADVGDGGDIDGEASSKPRRSGDNDCNDFIFTGGSGEIGCDLSRSRVGLPPLPPPPPLQIVRKIWCRFSAKRSASRKLNTNARAGKSNKSSKMHK
jgi:hypothetical protein